MHVSFLKGIDDGECKNVSLGLLTNCNRYIVVRMMVGLCLDGFIAFQILSL